MPQSNRLREGASVFPTPHLLERPWKADGLLGLPEGELRAWYENMRKGLDLDSNWLKVGFKVGDDLLYFIMKPASLILPDGTEKTITPTRTETERDTKGVLRDPKDEVTQILLSEIKPPKVPVVGLAQPLEKVIEGIVEAEFYHLRRYGVEKSGLFELFFNGLRHVSCPQSGGIIVSTTELNFSPNGRLHTNWILNYTAPRGEKRDSYCDYHSHPTEVYPSIVDMKLMISSGSHSTIIGAGQEDGSYRVVEWNLKKEYTVKEVEAALANGRGNYMEGVFGQMSAAENKLFVDEHFDRKEYVLRDEGGRMTFKRKGGWAYYLLIFLYTSISHASAVPAS